LKRAKDIGKLLDTGYSDITKFNIEECTDLSYEEISELVHYLLTDPPEYSLDIMPGAEETLTELSKYTTVTFVTARPGIYRKSTKEKLCSVLPNVDKNKIHVLHISGTKKHEMLHKLKINYFVEDRRRNARILNKKGIYTLLYDRPWNQSKETFHRVKSWDEIRDFIFDEGVL